MDLNYIFKYFRYHLVNVIEKFLFYLDLIYGVHFIDKQKFLTQKTNLVQQPKIEDNVVRKKNLRPCSFMQTYLPSVR
jgi:hypothetical protein